MVLGLEIKNFELDFLDNLFYREELERGHKRMQKPVFLIC